MHCFSSQPKAPGFIHSNRIELVTSSTSATGPLIHPVPVEGTISAAAKSAYFSQHKACDSQVSSCWDPTESQAPKVCEKNIWAHSPHFQQPREPNLGTNSWVQSSSHLRGLATCGPYIGVRLNMAVSFTFASFCNRIWLVVSTPLKNISQNGNLPQMGVKIKNI